MDKCKHSLKTEWAWANIIKESDCPNCKTKLIYYIQQLEAQNKRYREALLSLINSEVIKTAEFISYSEAYNRALEVVKEDNGTR